MLFHRGKAIALFIIMVLVSLFYLHKLDLNNGIQWLIKKNITVRAMVSDEGGDTGDDSSGGDSSDDDSDSCFLAGTHILMADGSSKNIEDVTVGDQVIGFDGSKNVTAKVLELQTQMSDHYYDVKLANGTDLKLTKNHAVYTQEGWKSIDPQATRKETPGPSVQKRLAPHLTQQPIFASTMPRVQQPEPCVIVTFSSPRSRSLSSGKSPR